MRVEINKEINGLFNSVMVKVMRRFRKYILEIIYKFIIKVKNDINEYKIYFILN